MAIEFAFVVILLVMLVFGITEIGRALYQLNTMAKAATAGARYMARAHGAVYIDPEAEDPDCEKVSGTWDDAVEKARNIVLYGSEVEGTETLLPDMTVENDDIELKNVSDVVPTPTLPLTGCVIRLTVKANYLSLFSGGGIIPLDDIEMSESVEERYIGE